MTKKSDFREDGSTNVSQSASWVSGSSDKVHKWEEKATVEARPWETGWQGEQTQMGNRCWEVANSYRTRSIHPLVPLSQEAAWMADPLAL